MNTPLFGGGHCLEAGLWYVPTTAGGLTEKSTIFCSPHAPWLSLSVPCSPTGTNEKQSAYAVPSAVAPDHPNLIAALVAPAGAVTVAGERASVA